VCKEGCKCCSKWVILPNGEPSDNHALEQSGGRRLSEALLVVTKVVASGVAGASLTGWLVKNDGLIWAWVEDDVASIVVKVLVIVSGSGLPGGHFSAREGNVDGQYAAGRLARSECWSVLIWLM
jgi:hypothetical protein